MKQITVIDASSDIKNKLPKEYRNMKVRFFQYSLDAFYYKSDDIFVRLNESDKENELVKVEYKDDIVKRIIDDYKRSFKEYDKALDELLEEK